MMATKGNSNRAQKNGVRFALATAATVVTLLGAQTLAFSGKSTTSAQTNQQNTVLASSTGGYTLQTVNNDQMSYDQSTSASYGSQITTAQNQPYPRSHSSR